MRETLWLGTDDDGLSVILQCYMEFILILLYMSYIGYVESSPQFKVSYCRSSVACSSMLGASAASSTLTMAAKISALDYCKKRRFTAYIGAD